MLAHPPAGSAYEGRGSEGNYKTGVSGLELQYTWPDVSDRLLSRQHTVIASTLEGGTGGLIGVKIS